MLHIHSIGLNLKEGAWSASLDVEVNNHGAGMKIDGTLDEIELSIRQLMTARSLILHAQKASEECAQCNLDAMGKDAIAR